MKVGKNKQGFTIVELLIVIVVIAILAAITIVAYTGITNRANDSAISSELSQNTKKILSAAATGGANYFPASVMVDGLQATKFNSNYRVVTYCANANDFLLFLETTSGKKYYSKSGAPMVQNDSIDSFQPCASLSISGAYTTYLNLPSICANENGTCTLSTASTVVYGSAAQGRFNRLVNQTGTVTCNNTTFGDPASGFAKACYVYPN